MSFSAGARVGAYSIIEKLGQGGMATVFKARHEKLDRFVAIKVLHPAFKDDDTFLRRFTREAQVVARLEHPHIVPVYDFAEHEGYPYLVMRFIDGETLKETLNRGALSRKEIVRLVTAIGEGLHYAHQQGVLHRDVKPSNILLTADGGVFIADFGLARITHAGESTLSQDMIMGTPQYISPEQAKGETELDGRTDLYSFGIIAYEMITGRVPFQADTNYAIIHAHIFEPPPPPSGINPHISPAMEAILLRALDKEPAERFADARDFSAAFRQAALDLPSAIAPAGKTVLPDPTAGVTRVSPADVTPVPKLPDLSMVPETTVSPTPPPKQARSGWPWIIGGAAGGIFLCLALILLALRLQQQRVLQAESTATAFAAATQAAGAGTATALAQIPPPTATADGRPPILGDRLPDLNLSNPRSATELEPLLEADPENIQLKLELVLAYWQEGRDEDARALLNGLLETVRTPTAVQLLAARLLENEEYGIAVIILEEGAARFQNDQDLQELLMMAYILNQQAASRVRDYMDLISSRRPSPDTITLGEAYIALEQGNSTRSIQILTDRLANRMLDYPFDLQYLLGIAHQTAGNSARADAAWQAAREHPGIPDWLDDLIIKNLVEL